MAPKYRPCYYDDECPEFKQCDIIINVCVPDEKNGVTIASSIQPTLKVEQTIASTISQATIGDSTSNLADVYAQEDTLKTGWIIIYTLVAICALLILGCIIIHLKPLVIKMLRTQRQSPSNTDKEDIAEEEINPLKNAVQPSVDQESSALPTVKIVTSARGRSRYPSGN